MASLSQESTNINLWSMPLSSTGLNTSHWTSSLSCTGECLLRLSIVRREKAMSIVSIMEVKSQAILYGSEPEGRSSPGLAAVFINRSRALDRTVSSGEPLDRSKRAVLMQELNRLRGCQRRTFQRRLMAHFLRHVWNSI